MKLRVIKPSNFQAEITKVLCIANETGTDWARAFSTVSQSGWYCHSVVVISSTE